MLSEEAAAQSENVPTGKENVQLKRSLSRLLNIHVMTNLNRYQVLEWIIKMSHGYECHLLWYVMFILG